MQGLPRFLKRELRLGRGAPQWAVILWGLVVVVLLPAVIVGLYLLGGGGGGPP
jgi:hypothetical protein